MLCTVTAATATSSNVSLCAIPSCFMPFVEARKVETLQLGRVQGNASGRDLVLSSQERQAYTSISPKSLKVSTSMFSSVLSAMWSLEGKMQWHLSPSYRTALLSRVLSITLAEWSMRSTLHIPRSLIKPLYAIAGAAVSLGKKASLPTLLCTQLLSVSRPTTHSLTGRDCFRQQRVAHCVCTSEITPLILVHVVP